MTYKKKLIEVALPLEAINKAAAREKSIRHGHPSTLHLWWARRPLAACRAVLFASLVDDPSNFPDKFPTEKAQKKERKRLFKIIEDLVLWENTNNERVLEAARKEILKSTDGNPPPVLDPFCGGGSIPLEAQRLGLEAHASDLNPVAVLITKALIEIPPKFAGKPPVNPKSRGERLDKHKWHGAEGLAEDVRYYGQWMRDEAEKRIGHLYPKVKIPTGHKGKEEEATVIAWLWARTVKCPNPACNAQMPLVRSFWLSKKEGKGAWVEPVIDKKNKTVGFAVRTGKGSPPDPPKMARGAKFRCLVCGEVADEDAVRAEFKAKRDGSTLMAIVAESEAGRVYLPPDVSHVAIARKAKPAWMPEEEMSQNTTALVSGRGYGITHWRELFTSRQLVALTTFSDLVGEARELVLKDAVATGLVDDSKTLDSGGTGATAYADAVASYLGLAVSRSANTICSFAVWSPSRDQSVNVFSRQALPMNWDFPEVNPFARAAGDFGETTASMSKTIANAPAAKQGYVRQSDAAAKGVFGNSVLFSTDPPYYDNIGYADLSDFFYVWLRKSIRKVHPILFSTVLVPKTQEIIAAPHRFDGDKQASQVFFERALGQAFSHMREAQHPDYPLTVFYAFKQSEEDEVGEEAPTVASTGWETMLEGLIKAGFGICGTWPMRTERPTGVKVGVNALASSIVIVCRPRPDGASLATRREFVAALKKELPHALTELVQGGIAPVDLAQAAIGPGMAVFSRYAKVLEADGSPMSVRTALQVINQHLDEYFAEQEGDVDPDTRFAVAWFEQFGMKDGPFGEADVLARAKNTSVQGVVDSGILLSKGGKVRLRMRKEYPDKWDPLTDARVAVWECVQYLIKVLEEDGEEAAAELARRLGGKADDARALAYRLFHISERKKLPDEALAYNSLVVSWSGLSEKAGKTKKAGGKEVQRDDLV